MAALAIVLGYLALGLLTEALTALESKVLQGENMSMPAVVITILFWPVFLVLMVIHLHGS